MKRREYSTPAKKTGERPKKNSFIFHLKACPNSSGPLLLSVICMGKDMAKVLLPASGTMADLGQSVRQTEEAAGQGTDSCQRGGRDRKGAEGEDRLCPSPPETLHQDNASFFFRALKCQPLTSFPVPHKLHLQVILSTNIWFLEFKLTPL